ncbi:uncharacterized protein LOC133754348 isoform X1 [Lepus europaeus]|uniref:uncharacterized protein LOC133754348 isoform X1 n=1 Tax=Lepus europaeus TaxID=9983 RepID=UPI002B49280A|nr:uncharacterized protein LOC133754348 isoform X1 [Lepus europaeus]
MDGILPPPQNQAVDSCCVGRERCLQTYLGFGDRCRSEQKPARGSTSNPPGTTRKILSRLRMPMPRPWMFLGIVHRSLPGEPAALRQPAPTIAPIVTGVRKGRHSQLDFVAGTSAELRCATFHPGASSRLPSHWDAPALTHRLLQVPVLCDTAVSFLGIHLPRAHNDTRSRSFVTA